MNFPYGRTHLFRMLKTLGFKYKKRGRESILNERLDLIMWRESFLRRIREVREKEPQREIVYTHETWLNGRHRVKIEWVDLKALENPRRSIKEYGTVGCTKDNVGKGKRIIIVDCIITLCMKLSWFCHTNSGQLFCNCPLFVIALVPGLFLAGNQTRRVVIGLLLLQNG